MLVKARYLSILLDYHSVEYCCERNVLSSTYIHLVAERNHITQIVLPAKNSKEKLLNTRREQRPMD